MNKSLMKYHIECIMNNHKSYNKVFEDIKPIIGDMDDSELDKIVCRLIDDQIDILEVLYNDEMSLISWFIFDNDCGNNNLLSPADLKINTVDELVSILYGRLK